MLPPEIVILTPPEKWKENKNIFTQDSIDKERKMWLWLSAEMVGNQARHEKIKVATAAVRLLLEARSIFNYRQLQTY